ncbi:MAG: cell envelope integrity protein TolA [Thiotrichales bacterium]
MFEQIRKHPTAVLVALAIHVLLFAFFIIRLDWHHETPAHGEPITATLVGGNPALAKLERQIEPPKPAPVPESEPVPEPPKPVEPPQPPEPDPEELRRVEQQRLEAAEQQRAAEKRKQEEARRQAELTQRAQEEEARRQAEVKQRQQQEETRKREEAKKKADEEKRLADEKRKKDEDQRKQAAAEAQKAEAQKRQRDEERRLEQARLASALAAEESALASAAEGRKMNSLKAQWKSAIQRKVQGRWIKPAGTPAGRCEVDVVQSTSGNLIDVRVISSASCPPVMLQSVERAVWGSDPLPTAPDPRIFERQIRFTFEPPA